MKHPSNLRVAQSYTNTILNGIVIVCMCMLLLMCCLVQCIHVPYTALTMHLSNDNKERDSVTLYREFD